jgi:hypothetical protein
MRTPAHVPPARCPGGPLVSFAVAAALGLVACQPRARPSPTASVFHPPPSATFPEPGTPLAPAQPPSESREVALIRRMLKRVEGVRHLEAKRPVPGVLLGRAVLIERVKEHLSRELPPEAIRNEGLTLQLFGFLPTQFDYEAAEYRLLEEQLAGYYEPADGTMYMAGDLDDEQADATLAHELVHALQDQRWQLQDRSKYRPGQGDRSEAVSALAEGDATSAMYDVMVARAPSHHRRTALDLPDALFVEQIRQGMREGLGATAPHVMRSSLAAPYIYGTLFVHALRRRGGWDAVDQAWDDAPTTTEQILHVDKWLAHEPPARVAAPGFATLGAGWVVADEDSEGELGARIAFEEWMDPEPAAEVAEGWGGDRGVLLANGDRSAFAWRLRFDPGKTKDERAVRSFLAVTRALEGPIGPGRAPERSFFCRERADRGPLALARIGPELVFVLGPAHAGVGGWSSAGDCALARRWTREIAAEL